MLERHSKVWEGAGKKVSVTLFLSQWLLLIVNILVVNICVLHQGIYYPILLMRKLRHKDVSELAQGDTDG